jgi:pyruvate kinase
MTTKNPVALAPGASDIQAPDFLASIVATIGPASDSPEMVRRLIEAGVSVFRFNFSHGDFIAHGKRLATVREVAKQAGVEIGCLGDLQGPKIRVGLVPAGVGSPSPSGGGMVQVQAGEEVVLSATAKEAFYRDGARVGTRELVLPLTYTPMVREVQPGHRVLINDGLIRMIALDQHREAGELRCVVRVGGWISSKKGLNVPDSDLATPAITDRDWECVAWAVQNDLDFLALSFVREAKDVLELRERLSQMCPLVKPGREPVYGMYIPIVAKIEMPQAVKNLESIIDASDAIMVARGDLGVEMDIARVPVVQKRIVSSCRAAGKPCIVATQMLETMIENATPTRAEATDVANAIFDGADAVMLSAETATGKHPVLVVETMARIISVAEERLRELPAEFAPPSRFPPDQLTTAAMAHGAWNVAQTVKAKVIVCWSQRGLSATALSQNRFHVPIVAYSADAQSTRRMALLRGVLAVCSQPPGNGSLSEWNQAVDSLLQAKGLAKPGDWVVLVAGRPLGRSAASNTIAVYQCGKPTSGYGTR